MSSDMLPILIKGEISKKRLDEIFSKCEIKELWWKIKNHHNYQTVFYSIIKSQGIRGDILKELQQVCDHDVKLKIISRAIIIGIQREKCFDISVIIAEKEVLKILDENRSFTEKFHF